MKLLTAAVNTLCNMNATSTPNKSETGSSSVTHSLQDGLFVSIHTTITVLLFLIGMTSSMILFAKNSRRYYLEKKLRGIGVTEGQLLIICTLYCVVYAPCMTVNFLGSNFLYYGPMCSVLIWLYGSMHMVTLIMHCCLSICWVVRVLWPNINIKTHLLGLYIAITIAWILPFIVIGIHVAMLSGHFSLPSAIFCVHDLELPLYLPALVLPTIVITMTCYTVCFISSKEWKQVEFEISPRLADIVVLRKREVKAMNAHCTSYLMFVTLYLIWKCLFILFPEGDHYTVLALHLSMVLTPAVTLLSDNKLFSFTFTCQPISNRCCQLCIKKLSDNTQVGEPPSYADIMGEAGMNDSPEALRDTTELGVINPTQFAEVEEVNDLQCINTADENSEFEMRGLQQTENQITTSDIAYAQPNIFIITPTTQVTHDVVDEPVLTCNGFTTAM